MFLSKEIRNRNLQYEKALSGTQEQEPRMKECMSLVTRAFPIATGALYVRKYFNHESKEIAQDMMNVLKERFEVILRNVKWMDEATRFSAILKVKNMMSIIGYHKELMDDSQLTAYYEPLDIDENNYFESVLSIKSYESDRELKKLRETYIKSDWRNWYGAASIDAYNDMTKNVISFPAGVLQGRFFAVDRPNYLNYGAIGTVMGHEITHGFDDQVRLTD
jgi:predicted metalloendopeptidase